MTKVTKESLAERIKRLEYRPALSINEQYQLEAYRILLELMPDGEHEHKWMDVTYLGCETSLQMCECGAKRSVDNSKNHSDMVRAIQDVEMTHIRASHRPFNYENGEILEPKKSGYLNND